MKRRKRSFLCEVIIRRYEDFSDFWDNLFGKVLRNPKTPTARSRTYISILIEIYDEIKKGLKKC